MHLILIPLLIIAILVGIFEGGNIWKSLDLSVPSFGEGRLNVRQFFGAPPASQRSEPASDSPLQQLGD